MKQGKKLNLDIENYYGELRKAMITVRYQEGTFIDIETGEEVALQEGTLVAITLSAVNLKRQSDLKRASKVQKRLILRAGEVLHFYLKDERGSEEKYIVRLDEDLSMVKKGLKPALVKDCTCEVIGKESSTGRFEVFKEPIKVLSLNQAYFQSSLRFRPQIRSHTCNVYRTFRTHEGKLLEEFRF